MWCHCLLVLGCEDIVADRISLDSVVAILKWSSQPYGSKWVHRQAMHFLCEEFSQVMTSDVLYELSKEHLLAAIQSDYLQVMTYTNSPWVFPSARLSSSGFSKFRDRTLHLFVIAKVHYLHSLAGKMFHSRAGLTSAFSERIHQKHVH